MSAGTLATWIATAFACVSALAGVQRRTVVAYRSLAMSATFGGVAALWLARALWTADLSVAYVARHVILADAPWARLMALWVEPAGAGLVAASVVGGVALWRARSAALDADFATYAIVMLVLLAAPLAGAPLALLPFLPADGAASSPLLAHPGAVLAALALLGQVAAATVAFSRALGTYTGTAPAMATLPLLLAVACAGGRALAWTAAAVATGATDEVQLLLGRGGTWLASALVSALALRIAVHGQASARAVAEASLASLLIAIAGLLSAGTTDDVGPAARLLIVLGTAVLASAVWRGFPGDPRTWHGRVARLGVLLVLACTIVLVLSPDAPHAFPLRFVRSLGMVTVFSWSLLPWRPAVFAAFLVGGVGGGLVPEGTWTPFLPFLVGGTSAVVGVVLAVRRGQHQRAWLAAALATASFAAGLGSLRRVEVRRLEPGATWSVGRVTYAHQGISSYAEGNTTVLALAVGREPGGKFGRAEQREVVDARGAVLSPVWRRPASFPGVWRWEVAWLDRVESGDVAWVRVASIPGPWLWLAALGLLLAAGAVAAPGRVPNARVPRAGDAPVAAG